jgi:Ca2+-binding RTX toxin-like protein
LGAVRDSRPLTRFVAAAGAAAALLCAAPSYAAEQVQDGGFESVPCNDTFCEDSTNWAQHITPSVSPVHGPICRSDQSGCTFGGSGPAAGTHWARLGAWTEAGAYTAYYDNVTQQVAIPYAPATLSFKLRILQAANHTGTLSVTLDGTEVFTATDATAGYAAYAPVTVDVGQLAGAMRTLKFEGTSSSTAGGTSDSFEIDDVSLDAATPPPADPGQGEPPPGGGGSPPPTPTCHGKPATITGTAKGELLVGTRRADVIVAGGGADVIRARGGNDLVCAGAGNDQVDGGGGRDRLFGEGGRDRLSGGAGRDALIGGAGRDTLSGGGARDLCTGGAGRDRSTGGCERVRSL